MPVLNRTITTMRYQLAQAAAAQLASVAEHGLTRMAELANVPLPGTDGL